MLKKSILILVLIVAFSNMVWGADPTAYVINGLAYTLSKINLKTDLVTSNFATTGIVPNQIVIRDSLIYVINSGSADIHIYNMNTDTKIDSINIGGGWARNPWAMDFSDCSRYAYVTCFVADSLFKIDMLTKSKVDSFYIGDGPAGILILEKLNKGYVCNTAFISYPGNYGQGTVTVFDTKGDSILKVINVGTNPQYLDLDNEGELYVLCTGDYSSEWGKIYIIDPISDMIKDVVEIGGSPGFKPPKLWSQKGTMIDSFEIGGSPGIISISPDNIGYLAAGGWGTEGEVYTFDAKADTVFHGSLNPIRLPGNSGVVSVSAFQDSTVYTCNFQADNVTKIDSSGNILKTYYVGDGPQHLTFNYINGDANGDWSLELDDVILLAKYCFGLPVKLPKPIWRADPDCDCCIDLVDAIYLANHLLKSGPAPKHGCVN